MVLAKKNFEAGSQPCCSVFGRNASRERRSTSAGPTPERSEYESAGQMAMSDRVGAEPSWAGRSVMDDSPLCGRLDARPASSASSSIERSRSFPFPFSLVLQAIFSYRTANNMTPLLAPSPPAPTPLCVALVSTDDDELAVGEAPPVRLRPL